MKTILIICHKCGKEILKPKKEYDRQLRKGRIYFYCSLFCSAKGAHTIHTSIKSICLWCKKEFETTTHKHARKCCSNKCAHKYTQSFIDKEKLSLSIKKAWKRGDFDNVNFNNFNNCGRYGGRVLEPRIYNFTCIICQNSFQRITKKIIYNPIKVCSKECMSKLISRRNRNNPNCGGKLGYRRFPYKGFKMDSRWEVELARWMDEKGIKWDRSYKRHMFRWIDANGDERKYFPDFYLPDLNVYLDPKNNYYLKRDLSKLKYVMDTHKVKIFYGEVDEIKNLLTSSLNQV